MEEGEKDGSRGVKVYNKIISMSEDRGLIIEKLIIDK